MVDEAVDEVAAEVDAMADEADEADEAEDEADEAV